MFTLRHTHKHEKVPHHTHEKKSHTTHTKKVPHHTHEKVPHHTHTKYGLFTRKNIKCSAMQDPRTPHSQPPRGTNHAQRQNNYIPTYYMIQFYIMPYNNARLSYKIQRTINQTQQKNSRSKHTKHTQKNRDATQRILFYLIDARRQDPPLQRSFPRRRPRMEINTEHSSG